MRQTVIEQRIRCYKGGGGAAAVTEATKSLPQTPTSEDASKEAVKTLYRQQRARGFTSTILTRPGDVLGSGQKLGAVNATNYTSILGKSYGK